MIKLENKTAGAVAFYAGGCTPETGEIAAGRAVEVRAGGPTVREVIFGGSGDGQAPVRVHDVEDGSRVTLSLVVSKA
jgi:hypothetical protein